MPTTGGAEAAQHLEGAADAPGKRRRPGRVSLLRTAVALMGEHGYDGTSTRDIAAAAGVSVAALYYHFPSKQDLLREFLFDAHDVVLARLARAVEATDGSARDRLDVAVATLIAANLHDEWAKRAAQVAWREHGRLQPEDQRAVAATRDRMVEVLENVIRDGVAAGEFATADAKEVARAVLTLSISTVEPYPGMDLPLEEVIALHQRMAAALADAAPPPRPARPARPAPPRPPRKR